MAWDTEGTRRRLKEAATAEFAEHGPDGTTMARIAERAGINKERLYKYFGDKQALFETVLTDELDKLAVSVAPAPTTATRPSTPGAAPAWWPPRSGWPARGARGGRGWCDWRERWPWRAGQADRGLGHPTPDRDASFFNLSLWRVAWQDVLMGADTDVIGRMGPELELLLPRLDERSRRLVLGAVARAAGGGGVPAVGEAAGASWQTAADGRAELASGDDAWPGPCPRPRGA